MGERGLTVTLYAHCSSCVYVQAVAFVPQLQPLGQVTCVYTGRLKETPVRRKTGAKVWDLVELSELRRVLCAPLLAERNDHRGLAARGAGAHHCRCTPLAPTTQGRSPLPDQPHPSLSPEPCSARIQPGGPEKGNRGWWGQEGGGGQGQRHSRLG